MTKSILYMLSAADAEMVLENIFYLNMQELRELCDAYGIPYVIHLEAENGQTVKSRDMDRKAIVIDRILTFIKTGVTPPSTLFKKSVVSRAHLDRAPSEVDLVYYGQYRNHDPGILNLMKRLTDRKFEFGAVAQEVVRSFWARGKAPTYRQFAKSWLKAASQQPRPHPEWAFLTDLADGRAGADWKKTRVKIAERVLALLKRATRRSNVTPYRARVLSERL